MLEARGNTGGYSVLVCWECTGCYLLQAKQVWINSSIQVSCVLSDEKATGDLITHGADRLVASGIVSLRLLNNAARSALQLG